MEPKKFVGQFFFDSQHVLKYMMKALYPGDSIHAKPRLNLKAFLISSNNDAIIVLSMPPEKDKSNEVSSNSNLHSVEYFFSFFVRRLNII